MLLESWPTVWRRGNWLAFLGVSQFVAGVIVASWLYGGEGGYSFLGQYTSDLGRLRTHGGNSNLACAIVFNSSICILGVATTPCFLFLPTHAPDRVGWLTCAAGCGIVSSLALVGIGLTPYDRLFTLHHVALVVWIVSLLCACSLHAWALLTSREGMGLIALASVGLAILLVSYLLRGLEFVVIGGRSQSGDPHSAAILAQKQVVVAALAWYAACSVRMLIWPPEGIRTTKSKSRAPAYIPRRR